MGEGEKMVAVHPNEVASTEGQAPIPITPFWMRWRARKLGGDGAR